MSSSVPQDVGCDGKNSNVHQHATSAVNFTDGMTGDVVATSAAGGGVNLATVGRRHVRREDKVEAETETEENELQEEQMDRSEIASLEAEMCKLGSAMKCLQQRIQAIRLRQRDRAAKRVSTGRYETATTVSSDSTIHSTTSTAETPAADSKVLAAAPATAAAATTLKARAQPLSTNFSTMEDRVAACDVAGASDVATGGAAAVAAVEADESTSALPADNAGASDSEYLLPSTSPLRVPPRDHVSWPRTSLIQDEYTRYGRQLILPCVGMPGQLRLASASVLIVGAGGLGCPCAAYLAAAGIGRLGIVDDDAVEVSNLHRQVMHATLRSGMHKAESLQTSLGALNPHCEVVPHVTRLDAAAAAALFPHYDVIVDASDNVPTRYLINDAAILFKKPLVAGAAVRTEGQLTVYGYNGGPCMRCLFPEPPPAASVASCGEAGVLGPVPGLIGVAQATETLKILLGSGKPLSGRLLLYDSLGAAFRVVRLRSKRETCAVCGTAPSITSLGSVDYPDLGGAATCARTEAVLAKEFRLAPTELYLMLNEEKEEETTSTTAEADVGSEPKTGRRPRPVVKILDVRPEVQFGLCRLPGSLNVPFERLSSSGSSAAVTSLADNILEQAAGCPLVVLCRRGNDSQLAVKLLLSRKQKLLDGGTTDTVVASDDTLPLSIRDVRGGLEAWAAQVDATFPVY